ncbi:hypothetical protein C8J56DRAFT_976542 [Mycena floridula]|nr:hypothetical protein C8J56DRAFT_976500 [Mycena floridula]KAJ7575215.1 hypothetical protein C8J56DRAFT_976542 [Mycena floridula]
MASASDISGAFYGSYEPVAHSPPSFRHNHHPMAFQRQPQFPAQFQGSRSSSCNNHSDSSFPASNESIVQPEQTLTHEQQMDNFVRMLTSHQLFSSQNQAYLDQIRQNHQTTLEVNRLTVENRILRENFNALLFRLPSPSSSPSFASNNSAAPTNDPAPSSTSTSKVHPPLLISLYPDCKQYWKAAPAGKVKKARKPVRLVSDSDDDEDEASSSNEATTKNEEKTAPVWFQDKTGKLVEPSIYRQSTATARRIWTDMAEAGKFPKTFSTSGEQAIKEFRFEMEATIFELRLCDHGWKSDRIWKEHYNSWRKTWRQRAKKRVASEDEDEEEADARPKKKSKRSRQVVEAEKENGAENKAPERETEKTSKPKKPTIPLKSPLAGITVKSTSKRLPASSSTVSPAITPIPKPARKEQAALAPRLSISSVSPVSSSTPPVDLSLIEQLSSRILLLPSESLPFPSEDHPLIPYSRDPELVISEQGEVTWQTWDTIFNRLFSHDPKELKGLVVQGAGLIGLCRVLRRLVTRHGIDPGLLDGKITRLLKAIDDVSPPRIPRRIAKPSQKVIEAAATESTTVIKKATEPRWQSNKTWSKIQ